MCDMILSHFSAVRWLNVTYIFKLIVISEYLVHARLCDLCIVSC